jgi:4-hydroxy-tetrahydrodipicolinate synthase
MESDDKKFVPVMLTPFDEKGRIDFDGLSRVIDFYLASGVKGLFANCLSSEMYSLTEEERLHLIEHVVEYTDGAVPVVATGSFGSTLQGRVETVKRTYGAGVDAVILITSHFALADDPDEELIENLEQIFRLTEPIPLGVYECPAPYKRILTARVFAELLRSNRLVYHKDTSLNFDLVSEKIQVMKKVPNCRLEFFDAHTPNAIDSLQAGAKGMSSISGNFYPEILVWLCNHATHRDSQELVKWIQAELTRFDPVIHALYPVSAKYFMQKRGLGISELSRVQPMSLSRDQREQLDSIFVKFLGWCERLAITPVSVL